MENDGMFENEADGNDEEASDRESVKSDEGDTELPSIEFEGLQLKTTRDLMTVELFKKIQKLKG
jgi:hypothetical protein